MKVKVKGIFTIKQYRKGKLIHKEQFGNLATVEGRNYLLAVGFIDFTKSPTWYLGLIGNNSFTAVSELDTYISHAGWAEFTSYDEATRQEWVPEATPSEGTLTYDTVAEFTISASGTLKGAFVTNDPTKGDGSGTGVLWSAATFGVSVGTINVVDNDVIKIGYTVSLVI
jgi:hypothetical protein